MTAAEKLTSALKAANAPAAMIERAAAGYYGDFTSPLTFPIMQLVSDAKAAGLHQIAKQAMAGEYDG